VLTFAPLVLFCVLCSFDAIERMVDQRLGEFERWRALSTCHGLTAGLTEEEHIYVPLVANDEPTIQQAPM
jgi:hypothetical protein